MWGLESFRVNGDGVVEGDEQCDDANDVDDEVRAAEDDAFATAIIRLVASAAPTPIRCPVAVAPVRPDPSISSSDVELWPNAR